MYVPAGGLEGLLGAGRGGRGLVVLPPSVSSDGCGLVVCSTFFSSTTANGGVGVVGDSAVASFLTVSPSYGGGGAGVVGAGYRFCFFTVA